ncbi:MAG: hypothetical protein H6618_09520 [Deltaproteobacteria bacterium]|nr:hypothetical protein [Deltaproteobacteria bacterium]
MIELENTLKKEILPQSSTVRCFRSYAGWIIEAISLGMSGSDKDELHVKIRAKVEEKYPDDSYVHRTFLYSESLERFNRENGSILKTNHPVWDKYSRTQYIPLVCNDCCVYMSEYDSECIRHIGNNKVNHIIAVESKQTVKDIMTYNTSQTYLYLESNGIRLKISTEKKTSIDKSGIISIYIDF